MFQNVMYKTTFVGVKVKDLEADLLDKANRLKDQSTAASLF